MSFEHIKTMLNTASDTRKWLTTSKIVRGIKWWKSQEGQLVTMCLGAFAMASMSFGLLSSIAPETPANILANLLVPTFGLPLFVPFGMMFAHIVVDYCFSKIWNKKTFFTGQREWKWVMSCNTADIKSAVIENFMNLRGEQWDTLAPVLHKCVQEDGLPYLWWWDLNAHLVQNLPVKEPEVAPLQIVSVESLEEQLTRHAQTLKNTNHSLSI